MLVALRVCVCVRLAGLSWRKNCSVRDPTAPTAGSPGQTENRRTQWGQRSGRARRDTAGQPLVNSDQRETREVSASQMGGGRLKGEEFMGLKRGRSLWKSTHFFVLILTVIKFCYLTANYMALQQVMTKCCNGAPSGWLQYRPMDGDRIGLDECPFVVAERLVDSNHIDQVCH